MKKERNECASRIHPIILILLLLSIVGIPLIPVIDRILTDA